MRLWSERAEPVALPRNWIVQTIAPGLSANLTLGLVPEDAPAWDNTFIYILAHPSREEAKKNWDAMFADPAFQEMVKSEQTDKLVEKVDVTYMQPTNFSPMM